MKPLIFAVSALLAVSFVSAEYCGMAEQIWHVCVDEPNEIPLEDDVSDSSMKGKLYWIRNYSDVTAPKCYTYFCLGGSLLDNNCGVNCCCGGVGVGCEYCIAGDGTSQADVIKAWRVKYGLVKQALHKFN